jgi:hypothetical protein
VEDAPYLAKEFEEEFDQLDLMRLANHRAYIKLMIDGTPSKPFSAINLAARSDVGPINFG